jgi:hypothetical protein
MGEMMIAMLPNTAVKAAPFGRWTLRDKALRSTPYLQRWASWPADSFLPVSCNLSWNS